MTLEYFDAAAVRSGNFQLQPYKCFVKCFEFPLGYFNSTLAERTSILYILYYCIYLLCSGV